VPLKSSVLRGQVRAIDGDTLEMSVDSRNRRIRLEGIDACESQQNAYGSGQTWPCGQAATQWLRNFTYGLVVECRVSGNDRYGRLLARCSVNDNDIGANALSAGMAVHAYNYDSSYAKIEAKARAVKAGIWAYQFDKPAQWRRENPK
jgi:endonuclease YncB( thermonuclease family)